MDAPSTQLRSLLAELKLADDRQLRRCRSSVRALVRDLPAFDSVWIDALVQCRALTLYQAEAISSGRGRELAVGPYVLVEPLHRDERLTLFRARHTATGETVQLAQADGHEEDLHEAAARLEPILLAWSRTPGGLPRELHRGPHVLWVVSPMVEGVSAAALLVRRGRFPGEVVEGIAWQLAVSLAALENEGLCHGDLRASNLVLSHSGRAALRNWGVLAAIVPAVTVHARVPLEFLGTLAPERIRQPVTPNTTSDIYSLGSLLWQLLVGRSPFIESDPLALRAAHLKRRIPEVREFAPGTSSRLAHLIGRMTEPDPAQRLRSFADVQKEWQTCVSRRRVARFVTSFESAAPRPLSPAGAPAANRTLVTAAALALMIIGATVAVRHGLTVRTQSVRKVDRQRAALSIKSDEALSGAPVVVAGYDAPANRPTSEGPLDELPAATSSGVITLVGGRRYRAASLSYSGRLVIRSHSARPAVVEVMDDPLEVRAEAVHLAGVEVKPAAGSRPVCLAHVIAQEVVIENCRFSSRPSPDQNAPPVAVRWEAVDAADPTSGTLRVEHTAFLQSGLAIEVHAPLGKVHFDNVLKSGAGPLLALKNGVRAAYRVPLVLDRCTLRESGPLVEWNGDALPKSGQLSIQGADTVIAPADEQPLILFKGRRVPPRWARYLEISAQGIVLPRELQLAAFRSTSTAGANVPLSSDELVVDGLLPGQFHFLGRELSSVNESVAIAENVPLRLSGTVIGADLRSTGAGTSEEELNEGAADRFTRAAQNPYNAHESLSPARDQQ